MADEYSYAEQVAAGMLDCGPESLPEELRRRIQHVRFFAGAPTQELTVEGIAIIVEQWGRDIAAEAAIASATPSEDESPATERSQ